MFNHIWKIGSLTVVGAIGVVASISSAGATNINSHGTICHHYNASQSADIDFVTSGTYNISSSSRSVICPVPRAPLASGATSGGFYIDGYNPTGKTTSCTLYSYNFNGSYLGSSSFSITTAGSFDKYVSLTSDQLSYFAYTSVLCTLPDSSSAKIYGITAIQ